MKKLLALLLLIPTLCFGQSETHDFITYDTTISIFTPPFGPTNNWYIRISRPRNYFVAGNPDTASRPWIITMPGQGEMGSNAGATSAGAQGCHYWLQHGWDGGVQLGNGKHYPILVTILYMNAVYTYAPDVLNVVDTLFKYYHPLARGKHFTGLSEGAFTWTSQVSYEKSPLSEDGMSRMTSLCALEGTPNAPVNNWDRGTTAWKVWAKKYNGKFFYLEGNGSDNFRNGYLYSQPMNDTVPNSAYFSWENLGGGAHCCWNSMWDPSATNWSCVPPMGPNNVTGPAPNTMGTYFVPSSLYQWMLRQGDTTLVGSTPCNPTVNAGADFNITLPANSVIQTGTATSQCGNAITSILWSQIAGPNTATMSNSTSLTNTFSNLVVGTYDFRLTATDNTGSTNIDDFLVVVNPTGRACRVFTWPTTQGNITNINGTLIAAGQPALHGCDIVYVDTKAGGYRTFAPQNLGNIADSQDILIQFINGAYITPNTSSIQAAIWDSLNHVRIKGLNITNNVDPVAVKFGVNGHIHFLTLDSCIFKGMPGMFGSGTPNTTTLPLLDTTNQYDTVNTFYKVRIHNCRFDSTLYHGLTAIWFNGAINNPPLNQIFLFPEVDSCFFNNYSSNGAPACYINLTACFGAKIHDNQFQNLGIDTPYVGHAATIFSKFTQAYVYRNHYGPHNMGNDFRCAGNGEIKQFVWLMKRENPLYDGHTWFCFNLSEHKVKYPMIELGADPVDSSLKWYIPRSSPLVFNNTFFRPGMGVNTVLGGKAPYNTSIADEYGAPWDSVFFKNNMEIGPLTDTTCWNCTVTYGVVAAVSGQLVTYPNGTNVKKNDTTANRITGVWLTNSYTDSVSWKPVLNGILYSQGVSTGIPVGASGITDQDYFHNPYPTIGRGSVGQGQGIDIGAFQLIQPLIINSLYFQIHTRIIGP